MVVIIEALASDDEGLIGVENGVKVRLKHAREMEDGRRAEGVPDTKDLSRRRRRWPGHVW